MNEHNLQLENQMNEPRSQTKMRELEKETMIAVDDTANGFVVKIRYDGVWLDIATTEFRTIADMLVKALWNDKLQGGLDL